jgi:hypothetical protein
MGKMMAEQQPSNHPIFPFGEKVPRALRKTVEMMRQSEVKSL